MTGILPSVLHYPDDLRKLAHVPSPIHYVTFADEVAIPGQDGEKADSLLQHSKKSGVKVLSELTWEAARRLLRNGLVPGYHGGLFNEEETRQLAFELRRVIAPADLLGRSRIRLRQAHAEKYHEDEPTDFTVFKEPARIGPMEPEQALAYFKKLVPTLGKDPRHWGPLMERQAFTMAEATSLTLLKKVQDVIAKHLEKGSPLPKHSVQAIEEILQEAGVSPKNSGYSEAVFRTNMMEAYRAGAQREFSDPDLRTAFPVWKYIGISDGRERQGPLPKYADHHRWFGKYFDRAVPFVVVRGIEAKDVVNCVLPKNEVLGDVQASSKAIYSGDAFEVKMSSGVLFTITANHPIFSENGLIVARHLHQGLQTWSYFIHKQASANCNKNHCPTLIDEVFESESSVAACKAVSRFDFYGDGKFFQSDIHVKWTKRLRLSAGNLAHLKPINKFRLKSSLSSRMRGSESSQSRFSRHCGPFDSFSLRLAPGLDAHFYQSLSDGIAVNTEVISAGILGNHPSYIHLPEFFQRNCSRLPGEVILDRIVNVRRFHYEGPVYDLQADQGYFMLGNHKNTMAFSKNCRCDFVGVPRRRWEKLKQAGAQLERWPQ